MALPFSEKKTFLRIETQQTNQQIIINGVPHDNDLEVYIAVCDNCGTGIYSDPPGTPYSLFSLHLDTLAINNRLGYCPNCGFKLTWSPTIDIAPADNQSS